jgi:hypothetical protein
MTGLKPTSSTTSETSKPLKPYTFSHVPIMSPVSVTIPEVLKSPMMLNSSGGFLANVACAFNNDDYNISDDNLSKKKREKNAFSWPGWLVGGEDVP